MNRLLPATLVASLLFVLLVAGCGGGGGGAGSAKPKNPLDDALGYVPKDGGFAVAIDTDVDGSQAKAVTALVKKFPFAGALQSGFDDQLQKQKLSFAKDVKPLLGNDFVVGSTNAKSVVDNADDNDFVGAIRLADKGKLDALIKKTKSKKIGDHADATLYKDAQDSDVFAVDDAMLVVAGSRRLLEQALDRHKAGSGLRQDAFEKGLKDLPDEALVRVSGSVRALLDADPDSAQARKVKWVDALSDFGVTFSAADDALAVDFRFGTDGADLTDADLPIASGDDSPAVIQKSGEIGFGMRDIGQLVTFYESAAQAANPSDYSGYLDGKRKLESQLGIDIQKDVLDQLEGDVTSSTAINGKSGMRAELADPAAFKKTLAKLGKVVPKLIERASGRRVGYSKPKGKNGYYALSTGGQTVTYGVVGDHFVASNDSTSIAGLASDDPKPVDGAKGAIAMKADAQQLVAQAVSRFGAAFGSGGALGTALFTGPLGDLTASVSAGRSALKGQLKLGFN